MFHERESDINTNFGIEIPKIWCYKPTYALEEDIKRYVWEILLDVIEWTELDQHRF